MTEGDVVKALAVHHEGTEWAFLAQVRNQTGFGRSVRTADAMAFRLWPSRGIYATGYEVKVSRQDLRKELDDPSKAEEIARFCKLWFIAAPEGICKPDDLPITWGLVEVKATGKLKWTKPATPNEHAIEPTWPFVCAIMRRVAESSIPMATFQSQIAAKAAEIEKRSQESQSWELKEARNGLERERERIAAFEKESGIKLDRYSEYFQGEIGQAVKLLRDMRNATPMDRLMELKSKAQQIADDIETFAAAFSIVKEQQP